MHPIRVQPNTSVVRAIDRGQWQAPLGSSRGPTIRLLAACRRARVRQGQAFGGAEEAPSLTAAARDGDANMRSGRKNACGAGRTKEWNDKGRQKWRDASLTKKAPYKPDAGNLHVRFDERDVETEPWCEPLRHRQTKEAATDMFYLQPPRHISTLPKAALRRMAASGGYCCKSLFGGWDSNSPSRRRGD